ncbi:DUF309 domain-containing protein [Vulcanisaeta thermophila]|uniref:DUF309 domain-containing protein n=1 Tax=Vulcanisaeta thermophila TaxID=867917 RepID=UPI0008533D24|nr:DUF309 domain-containing protein [Vulcanisaeta thermophila]
MTRYLIVIESEDYVTKRRTEIMNSLRAMGMRVLNARVTTGHVEVDLITDDIDGELKKLSKAGMRVMDLVDLDVERHVENPLEAYVELMGQERFWEAHEVLEGVWRRNRSEFMRGLILLAAALAKLQEGGHTGYKRLIRDAVELIVRNCTPEALNPNHTNT